MPLLMFPYVAPLPNVHLGKWLLALFSAVQPAPPDMLLAVADSQHPVQAPEHVRVIELDAPARIEAELSRALTQDPVAGSNEVRQRLADGGAELQRQLANAYQGVVDSWSLGITKVPAVVVLTADQRYVVYGEPVVARAVARITAYREAQP